MKFTCPVCGYTAKESAFLEGVCPACVHDVETGEAVAGAIPTVFHDPQESLPSTQAERSACYDSVVVEGCFECMFCAQDSDRCEHPALVPGPKLIIGVHHSLAAMVPVNPRVRREARALGINPGEGTPEGCPLRRKPTVITLKENP